MCKSYEVSIVNTVERTSNLMETKHREILELTLAEVETTLSPVNCRTPKNSVPVQIKSHDHSAKSDPIPSSLNLLGT